MPDRENNPASHYGHRTWKEFLDNGLLWWINRGLHLFGWAIVVVEEADGSISDAYPARVSYRGFSTLYEDSGFQRLTRFLKDEASDLLADVEVGRVEENKMGVEEPDDAYYS